MTSIFLTGATGVIGRRAVPLLIAARHEVTAVGRTRAKLESLTRMGATPIEVDLFDRDAVRGAVQGHDVVINLATHIPSTARMFVPGAWRENDRIRRDVSRNLADAAIACGSARFIQESFAPMYADAGDAWIDGRSRLRPARYNRSTLAAEHSAQRASKRGLAGVVLRFGAFYGPDARQTRDMIKVVRSGWSPLPGPPEGFVSSVSHDDAATAVIAALSIDEGVYNVVDDEPLTRREFAESLAQALGVPAPNFVPVWIARLGGSLGELLSRSLRISNRKLRAATDWIPIYPSVREGWPAIVEELEAPR